MLSDQSQGVSVQSEYDLIDVTDDKINHGRKINLARWQKSVINYNLGYVYYVSKVKVQETNQ